MPSSPSIAPSPLPWPSVEAHMRSNYLHLPWPFLLAPQGWTRLLHVCDNPALRYRSQVLAPSAQLCLHRVGTSRVSRAPRDAPLVIRTAHIKWPRSSRDALSMPMAARWTAAFLLTIYCDTHAALALPVNCSVALAAAQGVRCKAPPSQH